MHKGRNSGGAYCICTEQMGAIENAKIIGIVVTFC